MFPLPSTQQLPVERMQNLAGIYGSLKQLLNVPSPGYIASTLLVQSELRTTVSAQGKKGFRPPQWGAYKSLDTAGLGFYTNLNDSDLTFMQIEDVNGNVENYFFDAVFVTDHSTQRQITSHPVQWGAAITDHSYQEPASVSLQIGMSDVMDSFDSNQYASQSLSKSVNAYRMFITLQKTGVPVTLNTKLQRYTNMVIANINTSDDARTIYSLKATITFKEILIGETSKVSKSAYPAEVTPESLKRADTTKVKEEVKASIAASTAGRGYYVLKNEVTTNVPSIANFSGF
jgi:hypothetical protein